MKIAIPVYHLRRTGGMERYTWEVGRGLAEAGHEVGFVALAASAEAPPPGATLDGIRGGRRSNSIAGAGELVTFGVRASVRIRRRHRGTAVYGPLGSHYLPGVVTAQSVHGAWVRDRGRYLGTPRPSVFDRALIRMEQATYRRSAISITALSPICAADVCDMYGVDLDRITVVAPAADLATFRPPTSEQRASARQRFGLAADDLAIGVVANYAYQRKCVGNLIDASARTGARLLVAGTSDRSQSDYERRAVAAGARVDFLGLLADVDRLYHAIDIFALPSVNEAYGIAAHEAMAAGLPAILSTRCGIAGLLDAGRQYVQVEPADTDQLVAAIGKLADPTERARIAVNGMAWARSRTWDDVAAELAVVIEASPTG